MSTSIEQKNNQNVSLTTLPKFNFDEWASLHKNDPVAFEEKRIEWLTICVVEAPKKYQKRLNGLMFHINTIRRTEKNPMQTCLKNSSLMMDSLNDMRVFLSDLNATICNKSKLVKSENTDADILQFVRP